MELRKMKAEDWSQVAAIYTQGLEQGVSTFETVCPSYETWDKAHLQDCRLVAEEDEKVVGWAALSPTSARACYRGVAEVSIYIDDAYHHRGIGKALMKALEEESRKLDYWELYSSVFAVNEASLALHQACGFRQVGYRERIAQDRFGQWQNTIIWEKRL